MILIANFLTRKELCNIHILQQFVAIKEAFLKSMSEQEYTCHTWPKDAGYKGRSCKKVNLSCDKIRNLFPVVARINLPGFPFHWRIIAGSRLNKISNIGIKDLPSHTGADRVIEMLVSRLTGHYELTLYFSRRDSLARMDFPGVHLVRLPSLRGKYTYITLVDFLAAWHAVLCGDFDLIHLHNIEASFVLLILNLKYPVITTAHGLINFIEKWYRIPAALMRSMEIPYAYLSDELTSVSRQHAE